MPRKARQSLDLYPEPDGAAHSDVAQVRLTPLEVATFVESMTTELRAMARSARLDTLSYFLEMARIEASIQIERIAEREEED